MKDAIQRLEIEDLIEKISPDKEFFSSGSSEAGNIEDFDEHLVSLLEPDSIPATPPALSHKIRQS